MCAKKDNCLSHGTETINENIGCACVIRNITVLFTTDKQHMTSFGSVNICGRKTSAVFDQLSMNNNIGSACLIRKITVLSMRNKQCMIQLDM